MVIFLGSKTWVGAHQLESDGPGKFIDLIVSVFSVQISALYFMLSKIETIYLPNKSFVIMLLEKQE